LIKDFEGIVRIVNDGLVVLVSWIVFLVLLALLGFVILRGERHR
jgi:hypothetical protein